MNKYAVGAVALLAGIAGPSLAQGGPPPDPFGDATITQADFEKNAADRFDQLDANHDGSLSADERPFRGRGPGGNAAPISKDDFLAMTVRRFGMMDANHDGKLTKQERDDFRQQMMQRFRNGGGRTPPGQ